MIEYVFLAAGAAGAAWLVRRKHLARTATGPVPGIPGMARRPAGEGRWRAGRVYAEGARPAGFRSAASPYRCPAAGPPGCGSPP